MYNIIFSETIRCISTMFHFLHVHDCSCYYPGALVACVVNVIANQHITTSLKLISSLLRLQLFHDMLHGMASSGMDIDGECIDLMVARDLKVSLCIDISE